jgi:predicted CXXCH cytochrome family protein
MAATGVSCLSCHQAKETTSTGTVLWKASTAVCTQCHDEAANDRLIVLHEQLKDSLAKIEAELDHAREAIAAANLDASHAAEMSQRLRDLEDDLHFLRVGNSIHNMHYADSLLRAMVDKLRETCQELNIAEPAVELPQDLD